MYTDKLSHDWVIHAVVFYLGFIKAVISGVDRLDVNKNKYISHHV